LPRAQPAYSQLKREQSEALQQLGIIVELGALPELQAEKDAGGPAVAGLRPRGEAVGAKVRRIQRRIPLLDVRRLAMDRPMEPLSAGSSVLDALWIVAILATTSKNMRFALTCLLSLLPVCAEAAEKNTVYDHPRYFSNGLPIDYCLYPAKQCGHPAADRFCK
jgi:hypothetical protein